MAKGKQHDKQFKLDAVKYRKEHPDLTKKNVLKILVLVLAHWHAGNLNSVITVVIFLPVVLAIMPAMNKKRLHVSNANFVMPMMRLMY